MNDIRPPRPRRPLNSARPTQRPIEGAVPVSEPESLRSSQSHPQLDGLPPVQVAPTTSDTPLNAASNLGTPIAQKPAVTKKPFYKRWRLIALISLIFIVVALAAGFAWYKYQLSPVKSSATTTPEIIQIPSGTTPDQIADTLVEKSLIRSPLAFNIYTRLEGVRNKLQAGSYQISASESTPEIVGHLTSGQVEEMTVTFYPGSALNFTSGTDKTPSHRAVLEKLGYSGADIDRAFAATYDHPLLADKPDSADLEGYIYGQTYQVAVGASVEDVLIRTFDEFYDQLESQGALDMVKKSDMNLHEAIILASVIEREVSSGVDDQRRVSQVFNLRLEKGMPLGADATFVYAAKRLGQAPTVDIDSPYNTRKNKGLPPGPIASPGIDAVLAAVNPADGEYLYFVSGDDGRNYFSKTLDEHEANTQKYCVENCSLF